MSTEIKISPIVTYTNKIGREKRAEFFSILAYIKKCVPDSMPASIFGYPGFCMGGEPICSVKIHKYGFMISFFQSDVFDFFSPNIDCELGKSSIYIKNANDFMTPTIKKLIKTTAASVKVDSAFYSSIRLRDYNYIDQNKG